MGGAKAARVTKNSPGLARRPPACQKGGMRPRAPRALSSVTAARAAARRRWPPSVSRSCTSSKSDDSPTLTGDALLDPNNCLPCHADQFREWSGSMHAYAGGGSRLPRDEQAHAARDQRRGRHVLRELPCADGGAPRQDEGRPQPRRAPRRRCAASPATSATPPTRSKARTTTRFALATDGAMRGGITDPIKAAASRRVLDLSTIARRTTPPRCAAPATTSSPRTGAHIERTFDEWNASLYAKPGQLACGKCHMEGRDGLAAKVAGRAHRAASTITRWPRSTSRSRPSPRPTPSAPASRSSSTRRSSRSSA